MGTVNRNAPCPCGSGKKYKKCCLGSSVTSPLPPLEDSSLSWAKPSRGRDQDKEIDSFIIMGFDHLDKQEYIAACNSWFRVWDNLLLRLSPSMTSCKDTLPVYDGSFFLSDWIQEYCAAMHNAALDDAVWSKRGASFCSQILLQFPEESEPLQENFRASHGEFLFLSGEQEQGQEVLSKLIADRPHRSVGYAYLADMYGEPRFNVGKDKPIDLDRAIDLLNQGLAYPVEDAEDYSLEKRLGWFIEARGF